MNYKKDISIYTTVDGKQVFTSAFVFQQIQALNERIDRVRNIALVSFGMSTVALAAIILIKLLY